MVRPLVTDREYTPAGNHTMLSRPDIQKIDEVRIDVERCAVILPAPYDMPVLGESATSRLGITSDPQAIIHRPRSSRHPRAGQCSPWPSAGSLCIDRFDRTYYFMDN